MQLIINNFIKSSAFLKWHFLIAILMLLSALFFQYVMNLAPCELCIFQRLVFSFILIFSFMGIIFPLRSLRILLIFLILIGYGISFFLALYQIDIELGRVIAVCRLDSIFPKWFALDVWLPSVYKPLASCADVGWYFLGYTMAEILSLSAVILALWSFWSLLYSFKKNTKETNRYKLDL